MAVANITYTKCFSDGLSFSYIYSPLFFFNWNVEIGCQPNAGCGRRVWYSSNAWRTRVFSVNSCGESHEVNKKPFQNEKAIFKMEGSTATDQEL